MGQRKKKKIFSNYSFIIACGLAFVGVGFAIGGLFVSKNNQVAQEALAADAVSYMAWDEDSKSVKSVEGGCSEYTVVTDSTTSLADDGWYVVNSNVTISDLIEVSGTSNLILCDNYELTATKGIGLTEGASINIYAQSDGEGAGKLTVTGSGRAGIGPKLNVASGDITIHGGIINATGKSNGAGIGSGSHSSVSAITIHGGTITATGGADNAAGIGSGFDYDNEATVGTITINGGTITATGGQRAAGIGGGSSGNGGTITINGGAITAIGGYWAAGIGGGNNSNGGTVTINGGTITATGSEFAAGIGGGNGGKYENITINGGAITATGGEHAAGIGCGDAGECGNITISNQVTSLKATKGSEDNAYAIGRDRYGSCGTVTICGVVGEILDSPFTAPTITYNLNGGEFSDGVPGIYMPGTETTLPTTATKAFSEFVGWYNNSTFTGDPVTAISSTDSGNKEYWAKWLKGSVPYYAWDEDSKSVKSVEGGCTEYTVVTDSTTSWTGGGWYVVGSDATIASRVTVTGTANLILCDGATLTANEGISVNNGNTLNIYGQSGGTGALSATGNEEEAGIGAEQEGCGTINIYGGNITANGSYGAGIGGSFNGDGGNITIYGGTINATSLQGAIGGGPEGAGGTITIYGGNITALSTDRGAGIGGGEHASGGNITIHDGIVTAKGNYGAAIGGGSEGAGGTITINGGTVTATNLYDYSNAAGIGGGQNANGGTIYITGGTVYATGGAGAAGIGGGDFGNYSGTGGSITISGGTVYATGGSNSVGIGAGQNGTNHGSLTINETSLDVYGGDSQNPTTRINKDNNDDYARYRYMVVTSVATVTFNVNGGEWDGEHATSYEKGVGLTLPTNITKDSCVFGGWYDNENFEGDPVTAISSTDSGNKEFWAKWYGYYLVGDMNEWVLNENNQLTYNSKNTEYEEYYFDIDLNTSNNFKIGYGYPGEDVMTWYPDGMGNSFGEHGEITAAGPYRIFFRPDGLGGEGWFNGLIKIEENLSYYAWDGDSKTLKPVPGGCGGYNVVDSNTTSWTNGEWYVVNSDVTIGSRVNVSGTVNLILCDGASLKATEGIGVNAGNTLNIYAQALGTGTLTASSCDYWDSGIGGTQKNSAGNINIHGGIINATGVYYSQGRGAGIGGGYQNAGGTVNVYGGFVTATGGKTGGAGIGGGQDGNGGTLNVYGGIVFAYGNSGAAGIGHGSNNSTNGTLTVADHLAVLNGTTIIEKQNDDYERPSNMAITKISPVSFNKNGGTIHSGSFDQYPEGYVLNLPSDITKEGYVFAGWFKNAELNGESFTSTLTTDRDALEYWAKWDCTITYNTNGGSISGTYPTQYHKGTDTITLPTNVTKDGYFFGGWYDNQELNGSAITEFSTSDDEPKQYWAKWDYYYLVGTMNDGVISEEYKLTKNTASNEYYIDLDLTTTAEFKIALGNVEKGVMTLYPATGDYYGHNGEITVDGPYRVLFRPDGDGGDGWFNGFIKTNVNIPYYAWDEDSQTVKYVPGGCGDYTIVTSSTTSWSNGWYVVEGVVDINSRINVNGTVNLILCDGATLTAKTGIGVTSENTLNIYVQANRTGALIADASEADAEASCAGIGGNFGNNANVKNAGTINIHGGNVTAIGGPWSAGIGGSPSGNGGTVTIYSGTVNATGGSYGAGIGGGEDGNGGTLIVHAGTVNSTAGYFGAGIGGGKGGNGGTLTVHTGIVNATGGDQAAGIGGGSQGIGGTVTIHGGKVFAYAGDPSARGIGGGLFATNHGTLTVGDGLVVVCETTIVEKKAGDYERSTNMAVTILSPISFELGGGEFVGDPMTHYPEGVAYQLPTNVVNDTDGGFVFGGWYNDSEYTGSPVTTVPTTATGTLTYYAKWDRTITYNTNGGSISGTYPTQYHKGDGATLPTDVTKDGYVFGGWYDNADLNGAPVAEILTTEDEPKEYWARWDNYYLVGVNSVSDINDNYKLTLNTETTSYKEYYIDIDLKTTDTFRVVVGNPEKGIRVYYPADESYSGITADEPYRVYFRPNGDGGEGWFHNVIYVKSHAALVGDTSYFTLKDAYTAVSAGGTIKLLDDINLSSEADNYLIVGKNFTLDLNGHILDITSDVSNNKYKVKVLDGAILTVDDSSANVGGVKGACGVDSANSSYILLKNVRLSLDVESIKEASVTNHIAEDFILVPTNNGAPDTDGFLSLVRPMNDQDYADEVDALINNIGVVEYTASANKIKEARDAYNALTDTQKALVSKYDVLTTAEAAYSSFATNYINTLVNVPKITLDSEEDVIKARTAYDALTSEEKANIPELVVYRLVMAEKEINDIKQSNASIAEINALPAVGDLTLDNKDAVIAARAAYDALSPEGKEKVDSEVLDKLIAAEKEIKDIEESNNSINQINALPAVSDLTLDNKDAVIAARATYDALSTEGKAKVGDLVNTLVAAETQIKYLTDVKESTEASALINALPAVGDLTLDNKDAVLEAEAAYDALSTEGKAMVSSELTTKINELAVKMKNLIDVKESTEVTELIENLPDVSEVTVEDKDSVNQAREQYRNLSPEAKAMVSEEDLLKLLELERTLNDILAPANVNKAIDELPSLDELTLDDKDAVLAAKKAYDSLSPEGKKAVPEEKAAKVEAALERIAQLEKEKEEQVIEDFVSLVESLPSPENVTLDDAEKVMEAYRNQKRFYGKVPESLMNQLNLVYSALKTLQKQAQIGRTWYVGYSYDWIGGFFNRPNDNRVVINDHALVSIKFLSGNTFRFTFSGNNSWGETETYNFDFEVEGDKVPTGLRIISGTGDMGEEGAYNFGVVYEPKPVVTANKVTLEVAEPITYAVGRVVTVNAKFEPTYTTNQEVKWSVSGEGVLLYEDAACTILVTDETTQNTVYAKFVAAGEYNITATARNDESLQAVLTLEVIENDPIIGRKWFIGDSFEVNSPFYYRYGSIIADEDLNGAILVSIYNIQGYNTCYFTYEKPEGGDDSFSLSVANPEILPTGLTFVSGDGSHDNPYIVQEIYDEAPHVATNYMNLTFSTIQYAFVEGQVAILQATIDPHYASNQTVIWSVSSDSVVLYEDFECTTPLTNGITDIHNVYAKAEKAGNAIITVTSVDNGAAYASYVVDVVAKEGLVPFDYTLWTTYEYNKTWLEAYLEVRDVETGEAAARLTLTGDRDREDYLDVDHNKWGTSDTIYLPFGKNYELVWSESPYDGGWDDRYYNFKFYNPTTIDTIIDTGDQGSFRYKQDEVVATFLSTTEPIVRVETSSDSLYVVDGSVSVVTPYVKPGAVENKTLTWSVNKEETIALYSDSSCTESLPGVIDSDAPIYVKGLKAGVATITFTSVSDNSKVAYLPVVIYDKTAYTTIKYEFTDNYNTGASLDIVNTRTGEVIKTLESSGDTVNGEVVCLNDEYNLVWHSSYYDNGCSFVLYDIDDNVLFNSSDVTLKDGLIGTIGTPIEDSTLAASAEILINSLHEVGVIDLSEKGEIELVRNYYDSLTKEQKDLVDPEIVKKLVAAEKEIKDIEESNETKEAINELPVVGELTLEDKDDVEAARAAYEALSPEGKAKVSEETLKLLEAAEKEIKDIEESNASKESINALPEVADITFEDKDEIMAAKAAYDALSPEGKAKVSEEEVAKLEAAVKEVNDVIAAKESTDDINELPVVGELTLEDKADVVAARAAYDALTDYQKGKVSAEVLAKLVAAETEITDIETAKDADDKITELPDVGELTLEDKADVEAARAVYNALTEYQKGKVSTETLAKLAAAETEIVDIETAKETSDMITELPDVGEVTLEGKADVEAARTAYNALTEYQKGKVSAEVLAKLVAAETEIVDIETAKETSDMINALPVVGVLTLEDKEDVEAAKAAYDALTDYQKGKVSTEDVAKLNAAVKEINDIEAAKAAGEQIDELPSLDDITGMDDKDVDAAQAAIDALTPEAIAKLTDEELAKLEEAKEAIAEIKSIVVTEDSGNKSFTRDVDTKAAEEGVNVKQTFKTAANDEAKNKELTINAGDVTVSFDANAVNEIGNKATTFSVKLTYPEQGPEAKVDVSLNGVKFDTGISTVSFKYNKSIPGGMQAVVRYVDAEGNKTTMKTWMENGVISFETNHFSTFIVEYELTAGTIALIIVGSILAFLLLVGIVLFILDRMHVIHIAFIDRLFDKKAKEEQPVEQVQENEASNEENEEVVTVTDEKGNIFQIRFIKSFTAKLIQSPDETKKYYEVLKNYVLSYKKVTSRVSWNYDSINSGRNPVLKFAIRGKTLGVYYALNADDYADSKYKVEKVESKKFEDVPCLYRIKNDRRCEYAKDLIDAVMNKLGLEKGEEQKESYYLHYEENKPLIARGLIKEQKVQANQQANRETTVLSVITNADGDEVVTKRDSKGNIFQIRYIKSFTAKLSQSEQEVKDYYNELKNYALGFKKANSRVSWHFDSINVGRNQVIKFVIRGKTLCLYFALNADDYADSKYKVEKVESKKYEDVPCLYRIKNDRRRDYAKDLIDTVMANVPTEKGKESNEDFVVPYETTEALLEKGLIKELKVQANQPAESEVLESKVNADGDEVVLTKDSSGNIFEIRFIKSFSAKLSQAEDVLKNYYSELKNYALSYKGVNSRVSWHFDSCNAGRKQLLKFAIRGKTLCVYYALDAETLEEKYKAEKVESKKFEDVPCLYRIKNDRRCEYAKDLIDLLMNNNEVKKGKESHEDFSLPYEETEVLLAKGLIKEVKTKVNQPQEVHQAISVSEADKQMSDEKAEEAIVEDYGSRKHEGKKGIINIDTISENFNDGDTVDIEALIKKELIPSNVGFVKVLARGSLNKKLHLVLQDYSLQAVKMIILKGGTVKKTN